MKQKIITYSNGLKARLTGEIQGAYKEAEIEDEIDISEVSERDKKFLDSGINGLTVKKYKDRIKIEDKDSKKFFEVKLKGKK